MSNVPADCRVHLNKYVYTIKAVYILCIFNHVSQPCRLSFSAVCDKNMIVRWRTTFLEYKNIYCGSGFFFFHGSIGRRSCCTVCSSLDNDYVYQWRVLELVTLNRMSSYLNKFSCWLSRVELLSVHRHFCSCSQLARVATRSRSLPFVPVRISVLECVRAWVWLCACVCVCVRDLRRSVNCVPCVIREKPFCSVHENTSRRFGFFFASTASFAVSTNRFLCVPRRRRCRVHVEQHHGLRHAKTVARFRTPYVQTDQETKVHAYEHIAFELSPKQFQVRIRFAPFWGRCRPKNHGR